MSHVPKVSSNLYLIYIKVSSNLHLHSHDVSVVKMFDSFFLQTLLDNQLRLLQLPTNLSSLTTNGE